MVGDSQQFNFQPYQIVYLEHGNSRLYAEVVQYVKTRHLCWVRPIALVAAPEWVNWTEYDRLNVQSLQDGSDLMCPAALFEEALDIEVLPLLARLGAEVKGKNPLSHRHLHQFIHEIWQARPELFENKES